MNKVELKTIKEKITMKKLILCFTIIVFVFVACNKECQIKYPKNLKSIDWENYNDVYTVYWNTVHLCFETVNLQSDTIKISGWRAWNYGSFNLCDDPKYADRNSGYTNPSPIIFINFESSGYHPSWIPATLQKNAL